MYYLCSTVKTFDSDIRYFQSFRNIYKSCDLPSGLYQEQDFFSVFANISVIAQQTFVLMKMSWRRLEEVFRLRLQKTSWRRLEDVFIKTNKFALFNSSSEDVLINSNIFVLAIRLQVVFKTSSRRLTKTSSKRLVKTSSRHLQDVSKTFWRPLQDVFKTSSRRIAKTSSRPL